MLITADALRDIFLAGVARVDPNRLINDVLALDGDRLSVTAPGASATYDLSATPRVLVLGAGKATARMARAVETLLGDRIDDGVISVKYGHTESLTRVRCIEADHPVPDAEGIRASREMADLARSADENTLAINLISGGGSALMPYPAEFVTADVDIRLTLGEKQEVTRALLECGATINEVNCIRKHLSQIKGGRLAEMLYPAPSVSLILSDVVGDALDTIASGPTTFDATTFADAAAILEKYDLAPVLPPAVKAFVDLGVRGVVPDTPGPENRVFGRVDNVLIGTNFMSLEAAAEKAAALGYRTTILSSQVIGEAREVARVLCGIAKDARRQRLFGELPVCLICGGETTVTIRGSGRGGRNQEMALAFLAEMDQSPEDTRGIHFLAASTDGNDGPTDAAGAFADHAALDSARTAGLNISAYLKNNDAYRFFDRIGRLLKTGPTNTNVCDIQVMIIDE